MDTKELLKKIRKIELKTKGVSRQVFSGDYHSAFKGRGMAFSEVKNYQFGDDVRAIDWNVTARFNDTFVKVYEEERELSVMLIIDVSASLGLGSVLQTKSELMIELIAVLAFSAAMNNDKVGAIFVSDSVEKFIPPKKGRSHVLMLLKSLIEFKPKSNGTAINEGVKFFRNRLKKRSICFVISDFIDNSDFIEGLGIANRKHDIVALRVKDEMEKIIPNLGLVELVDVESGGKVWVNTSNKHARANYLNDFSMFENELKTNFRKSGIDFAEFSTGESYIHVINNFFVRRRK
jgi:uncharacterized protein (DUF58 family)